MDTLRYSDDPETAEKVLLHFLKLRFNEIEGFRENLHKEGKSDILFSYNYDAENSDYLYPYPLYIASRLCSLLADEWTPDSAIYDLEDWTGNLSEFRKRVETNPEKQFLVLVDFHY